MSLALTLLTGTLAVFIPLAAFIWLGVEQIHNLIQAVSAYINIDSINSATSALVDKVNVIASFFGAKDFSIDGSKLLSFLVEIIKSAGNFIIALVIGSVGGIPRFITNLIIFLYVFSALLTSYKKLFAFIGRVNPLGPDITDLYIKKASAMTSAMIKGQFLVAIAQGVVGALFLYIAGIPYFALFAVILSVMSIIPLGGGIITIPIGVFLMITGNIGGGLFILLTHFLVITNIDNFLRPRLVPKSVSINPALTMISVLAGVMLFGFSGIVLGPVLFIVALTTLDIFAKLANESKTLKEVEQTS